LQKIAYEIESFFILGSKGLFEVNGIFSGFKRFFGIEKYVWDWWDIFEIYRIFWDLWDFLGFPT